MNFFKNLFSNTTTQSIESKKQHNNNLVKIESFSDESITYYVNLNELTCTCTDWRETREKYKLDDPRRLCKHLIKELDINNLSCDMKYFRDSIKFYQDNKKSFYTYFDKLIYIDKADCKVLYSESGWISIFDVNGKKYGLLILDETFQWAITYGKPLHYEEIENYFNNDKFLSCIGLFDDEILSIKNKVKESGYKNIKIEPNIGYECCANSFIYDLIYYGNDNYLYDIDTIIEVSNQSYKFSSAYHQGFISNEIIYRDKYKVDQALKERKLLREKKDLERIKLKKQMKLFSETECYEYLFTEYKISFIDRIFFNEILYKCNLIKDIESTQNGLEYGVLIDGNFRIYPNKFEKLLAIIGDEIKLYRERQIVKKKELIIVLEDELKNTNRPYLLATNYSYKINPDEKLCDNVINAKNYSNEIKRYITLKELFKKYKVGIAKFKFLEILETLNILTRTEDLNKDGWIIRGNGLKYGINLIQNSTVLQRIIPYWYEVTVFNNKEEMFVINNDRECVRLTDILWREEKFLELVNLAKDEIKRMKSIKVKSKLQLERETWLKNVECPICQGKNIHKKDIRQRKLFRVQRYQCRDCVKIFQKRIEDNI